MVHCGVTSSGTQSSGLTMQSQRRERERERINISTTEMSFSTGACSRQINQCPHTIIIKLWAYRVNSSLSSLSLLQSSRSSFSLHHACSSLAGVLFSLTHTLARSLSIPLSLIVCLSLFLSLAPCNLVLGAEDSPWQVSLVYTGTDGHRGNVRLILSKFVYGAKSWL